MSEYINIGLDFGTHQTKVCIEDSSDPRNRTYTFLKFFEGTDEETYFLPSIIQVNKDNTLTYGRFDKSTARSYVKKKRKGEKPLLTLPQKPKTEIKPERPKLLLYSFDEYQNKKYGKTISKIEYRTHKKLTKKQKRKLIDEFTSNSAQVRLLEIEYEKYRKHAEQEHRNQIDRWIHDTYQIEKRNIEREKEWERNCDRIREEYDKEISKWKRPQSEEIFSVYRYFKISTFSKSYVWDLDINPIKLSIWYITYILFQIYKVVDENSSIQMGIPQSISDRDNSRWQLRNADIVFYSAYRLYLSYRSEDEFLHATINELNADTNLNNFEEPDFDTEPGLLVLPEAFASLTTITKEGKISRGLNLLMDIGGGSTDISLFNVIEKRKEFVPNISHILSVHKGLNHLFRLYVEDNDDVSIEEAREVFQNSPDKFEDYIRVFRNELAKEIQEKIYFPLLEAGSRSGITVTQIKEALYSRPVIYTGGGGVYDSFIDSMYVFTDPMSMSKDFVSIKNITNKDISDEELSILSVAYGLSIPQDREPEMTPLSKLFENIKMLSEGRVHYEHGISDIE